MHCRILVRVTFRYNGAEDSFSNNDERLSAGCLVVFQAVKAKTNLRHSAAMAHPYSAFSAIIFGLLQVSTEGQGLEDASHCLPFGPEAASSQRATSLVNFLT